MSKLKYFHPHDRKWILEQLEFFPVSMREGIEGKYSACYKEICDKHEGEIAQLSYARREANIRLRAAVKKYGKGGLAQVYSPGTI